MPYSQALRIKFFTARILKSHNKNENKIQKCGYNRSLIEQKFDGANLLER